MDHASFFSEATLIEIGVYVGLEMRFISGIFDWKVGCVGNVPVINLISRSGHLAVLYIHDWNLKNGGHSDPKTK